MIIFRRIYSDWCGKTSNLFCAKIKKIYDSNKKILENPSKNGKFLHKKWLKIPYRSFGLFFLSF